MENSTNSTSSTAIIEFIENKNLLCPTTDSIMERSEWDKIDDLIEIYQSQFKVTEVSSDARRQCDSAAQTLLEKFAPLFKKYLLLLKSGQINFKNSEQRMFVALFMDDIKLRKSLYGSKEIPKDIRAIIYQKFNFIRETYGKQNDEEIMTDLYIIFFTLAKRYKKMKRSFCCYVYNTIRYEMFRLIQSFTKNPANIHYRNVSYDDILNDNPAELFEATKTCEVEESVGFNSLGLPNADWFIGTACSELFATLTPLERKILSKYYLENRNDKQVSMELNIHINTCNTKRHQALEKLVNKLGLKKADIKRTRNSGRK